MLIAETDALRREFRSTPVLRFARRSQTVIVCDVQRHQQPPDSMRHPYAKTVRSAPGSDCQSTCRSRDRHRSEHSSCNRVKWSGGTLADHVIGDLPDHVIGNVVALGDHVIAVAA